MKRAAPVVVVDWGMGNLHSMAKALEAAGARAQITDSPRKIREASCVVLPGVGSFGQAMKEISQRHLGGALENCFADAKPFLGVCLGLQVLFERSEESRGTCGLGILRGNVIRFSNKRLKVPHMGWNDVILSQSSRTMGTPEGRDVLSRGQSGLSKKASFYFVHSYYVSPEAKEVILGRTRYGINFPSLFHLENGWACQFHPEKSQKNGLSFLRAFLRTWM